MLRKRITVFTGHFGSGKTELALNAALFAREDDPYVAITDLDVINPYFRSRDAAQTLRQHDIELIAPPERLAQADLPIVSGDIYRVLHDERYQLIVDAGGDKDGATALGQYFNEWKEMAVDLLFVLNTNRPYVSHLEGVIDTIKQIELVSRLKVTGLINNANTGHSTEISDIEKGEKLSKVISQKLDIPFLYTTVSNQLTSDFTSLTSHIYHIQRFMKVPWER